MRLTIDKSGAFPVARMTGEWRATDEQEYRDELHPLVAETGARLIIDLSGGYGPPANGANKASSYFGRI